MIVNDSRHRDIFLQSEFSQSLEPFKIAAISEFGNQERVRMIITETYLIVEYVFQNGEYEILGLMSENKTFTPESFIAQCSHRLTDILIYSSILNVATLSQKEK